MDNGWGEGGFGEMMGPRENTFPTIKLELGEKCIFRDGHFVGKIRLRENMCPQGKDGARERMWVGVSVGLKTIP
jgi:hypothetical protein